MGSSPTRSISGRPSLAEGLASQAKLNGRAELFSVSNSNRGNTYERHGERKVDKSGPM